MWENVIPCFVWGVYPNTDRMYHPGSSSNQFGPPPQDPHQPANPPPPPQDPHAPSTRAHSNPPQVSKELVLKYLLLIVVVQEVTFELNTLRVKFKDMIVFFWKSWSIFALVEHESRVFFFLNTFTEMQYGYKECWQFIKRSRELTKNI